MNIVYTFSINNLLGISGLGLTRWAILVIVKQRFKEE